MGRRGKEGWKERATEGRAIASTILVDRHLCMIQTAGCPLEGADSVVSRTRVK